MSIEIHLFIFLCLILAIVATTDLLYHKVYNFLTVPTIIISLIYLGIIQGMDGILHSLGGIALGMGILLLPYILGFTAAGDVKLMAAVGAALGPAGVLISYCYSAIFGGFYALILILIGKERALVTNIGSVIKTFVLTRSFLPEVKIKTEKKRTKICYGVPIALGTILYIVMEIMGKQLITF